MDPAQRQAHWEHVYRDKAETEVSWFQDDPAPSLELIALCGAGPHSAVIDVGAGASRLVDRLVADGYADVTALDVSAEALAAARARLGEAARGVHWLVADATAWTPERTYDLWHDRATLHFLVDPADRDAYRARLLQALKPGGAAILAAFAPDGPEKCSGLPVMRYDEAAFAAWLGPQFAPIAARRLDHLTPAGATQRFQFAAFRRAAAEPASGALPAFAHKADDLETLKKTVDDAASVGGGLWLSYLLALFYLMVAAGSVTHEDLFFEKPINLLLLNVQLPIVAFFALAPLLFLALHAYALVHLAMLTDKTRRFHAALYDQLGENEDMPEEEKRTRKLKRDALRGQLPSNVFVQFLAGPPQTRAGGFGFALRAIGWATLAFGPVALLLLFQAQFLPYHNEPIAWIHRGAPIADLWLIWWLWRRILSGREPAPRRGRLRWAWTALGAAASLAVVLFSAGLATYRGERWGEAVAALDRTGVVARLHETLFHSPVDEGTRRRPWPLSDTLVLPRVDALEGLKIANPDSVKWKDYIFIAQDRDLAGADFFRAILARIDFTGANLTGANFYEAQLDGASLGGAQLRGASLSNARLQGASLVGAQLQGASLFRARLQGASLLYAQLQGARLDQATIEATDLLSSYLWRSTGIDAELGDLRITLAPQTWGPFTLGLSLSGTRITEPSQWTPASYTELYNQIASLPAGAPRSDALERIKILDCNDNDPSLVSCDPVAAQTPPPAFVAWRDRLTAAAKVTDEKSRPALAKTLRELVCPGDENTLYVVRGKGFRDRLQAAGADALPLIGDLADKSGKACPVAAQLTDADRADLARIAAGEPPPPPQ